MLDMNWLLSFGSKLFGTLLSFFKDTYQEEMIRKEASEAKAAKARLQSALEAEAMEEELQAVAKAKPRVKREELPEVIRLYNRGRQSAQTQHRDVGGS